jgi:endonuclease YncB( thermonuclease family)
VLLGAALGIFLPVERPAPIAPQQAPNPTLPDEKPDAGRKLRDFSIVPAQVPASDDPATGSPSGATSTTFTFCAGRNGSNCVIDGDTFILGDETIRLGLIDAPELGNPACEAERELAQPAEQRLYTLLNAGAVSLQKVGDRDRDRFDRLLRDATVNGQSVSETLVSEGLARPWRGQKEPWC